MDDGGGDRMWKVGEWDEVSGAGERGWWGRWDEVAAVSDIRLYSTVFRTLLVPYILGSPSFSLKSIALVLGWLFTLSLTTTKVRHASHLRAIRPRRLSANWITDQPGDHNGIGG